MVLMASESISLSLTVTTGEVMISHTLKSLRGFILAAILTRLFLVTTSMIFFPSTSASCLQFSFTMISATSVTLLMQVTVGRLERTALTLVSGVALFFLRRVAYLTIPR